MSGGTTSGGGRAARDMRLLLLLVLAFTVVEYVIGSILNASPLRTYLCTPLYDASQPTFRNVEKRLTHLDKVQPTTIPKLCPEALSPRSQFTNKIVTLINNTNTLNVNNKSTSLESVTSFVNMTVNDGQVNAISTSPLVTTLIYGNRNRIMTEEELKKTEPNLPLCEATPPGLGPIQVNKTELELEFVENKYPEIEWGGRYEPPNCTARHKVAIIVPYRDRQQHLSIFLNHMHPFLMKQQIEYGIFVIEQEGFEDFNRAKLMNVGFVESEKLKPGGWQCFVFHDVDLLPSDTRNMYTCPRQPRHMAAAIDKFQYKSYYEDIFGGVSAFTKEQFTKVNGFSNKYWGWGGEDDDMISRLKKMNYHLSRYKMSIARYENLDHDKSASNPKRLKLLSQTAKAFKKDGLTTLEYEVVRIAHYHLYTYILANIDERS